MKKITSIFLLLLVVGLNNNSVVAQSKSWALINKNSAIAMINRNSEADPDIYKKSITYLNDCLKYFPRDYEAIYYRGVAKMNLKNNVGAITDFNAAIKLRDIEPFINAYYDRAICKIELKQYKEALSDLDMVKKWDPRTSNLIYTFYAMCNYNLGKIDEAKHNLALSLPDYPNVNDNYHIRGLIRLREKDYQGACEDFTKAKELGYKKSLEKEMAAACK